MSFLRCSKCGLQDTRYGTPDEMHKPCSNCGSLKFFATILDFTHSLRFMGSHEEPVDFSEYHNMEENK